MIVVGKFRATDLKILPNSLSKVSINYNAIKNKLYFNDMSFIALGQIRKTVFRVTLLYLNLLVKPRFFFRLSGGKIFFCILKGKIFPENKIIKNKCAYPI